jgi:hypothetical protein
MQREKRTRIISLHGTLAGWLFGETTGAVRHAVNIPVLFVREQA